MRYRRFVKNNAGDGIIEKWRYPPAMRQPPLGLRH
jgi:hypothetical protein